MHMRMLHGQPEGITKLNRGNDKYRNMGWIKELSIAVMATFQFSSSPGYLDSLQEAKRLLSDTDLFKGPKNLPKRPKPAHKPDRSVWGRL